MTYVLAVYHCKSCFIKLSILAASRLVENVLKNIANSIYPDQTDRIRSVGYVSTLIESILSTEWQCLKNKTDMYDFKKRDAFDTYL